MSTVPPRRSAAHQLLALRQLHGGRPRGTRFACSPVMAEIGLVEVSAAARGASLAAGPFDLDESATITLHFLLVSASGQLGLEALRNARRALLREEWTRGRGPDEPSLEDAVFSSREILWDVRPDQRAWCLEKLEELRRRANLLLTEVEPGVSPPSGL